MTRTALVLGTLGLLIGASYAPDGAGTPVRPAGDAFHFVFGVGGEVPLRPGASPDAYQDIVNRYCVSCHNDRQLRGNLSLQEFDVANAVTEAETAEKMVRKLRAGMMPPPGARRPTPDSLAGLAETLEAMLDAEYERAPNPGTRPFQRLNRAEYAASVRELLGLDIDAGDYLPLDTKSANFDNIADVQMLSATVMTSYLNAAAELAKLAVGDANASPVSTTYTNPGYVSQWERVEGAPRGTRGGISVVHHFPADGMYRFSMAFEHTTTGGFFGRVARGEEIEVSIDGAPVALLAVDRWMNVSDPNGVNQETDPVFVTAGPHRVSAAFLVQSEGPFEDLLSPHDWSLTDRQIGVSGYGVTAVAHLKDLVIEGPESTEGVSETPSRSLIFSCHPNEGSEAGACARQIIDRLAPVAYRRPVSERETGELFTFYQQGASEGGFEYGVRTAIQAILASPDFVFRFEQPASGVVASGADLGEGSYPLSDAALASRLSFFLWGMPPDEELRSLVEGGRLGDPEEMERQVERMLSDPRAEALATRFAAQWLRLDDLEKVHPDRLLFPDYYQQLSEAMRRETELFFYSLVRDDLSLFEFYTADYTYLNEILARHYGIPGVSGGEFRQVAYVDDRRRGIFGHGSVLTLTSHANRTSPVLRGKWVMEVLLGTPPPPPPPGVPDLEETDETGEGRLLTTRERMEVHRDNPQCRSCHIFMDPIGLALDNFDVTGRWRIREHGMMLDTRGEMYDGTRVESPQDLRAALIARPTPLLRTFTENLLAYAVGRRVEYFDQPAIRRIIADAAKDEYRMSAFVKGVVGSPAFRLGGAVTADSDGSSGS